MDWLFGPRRERVAHVGWQENESQLESVRRQLAENPEVFVAGEVFNPNPGPGYFAETHDIFVAPVEPIFNARKLNKFMDGLVHGIAPESKDEINSVGGGLSVGVLYFDEPVNPLFSQDGERRTWVRVFPKRNIAEFVAWYQDTLHKGQIVPALENVRFDLLSHHLKPEQVRLIKSHDKLADMGAPLVTPLLK